MKPYRQVPIHECGEPLVAIPLARFAVESPHPYVSAGATYADRSPYHLRQGVLDRLIQAQEQLQQLQPGWRLQIFDAYRPVEVQQYMVDYTFRQAVIARGFDPTQLSPADSERIWQDVYQIWAIPSFDLATPPPHSTGAAIDLTLVDENGTPLAMGSPIDEMSARSRPDYFRTDRDPSAPKYHHNRELLARVMSGAGFIRHPEEWWHFSLGDQLWAWLNHQVDAQQPLTAYYGRAI